MLSRNTRPKYCNPIPWLILTVGLLLCWLPACKNMKNPETNDYEVTIAYPTNLSPALMLIALDRGYFSRKGARIKALPFQTGKDAFERLLAGKADIAAVAETPISQAILNNTKFMIVATIEQSGQDVCLVARKDLGVCAPKDLKGTAIGYAPGTSGHYFLDAFLLANQIGSDEVRRIPSSPLTGRTALIEGRLDALVTWDPHVEILVDALAGRATLFKDQFLYTQVFCVVARTEFIRDHPDQVGAIIEGLFSARNLLSRSPLEAYASVARLAQVEPQLIAKAMTNHEFDVRLDQALLVSLEAECQWMMASGTVPVHSHPDFRSYLYTKGLANAHSQAVQIIQYDGSGLK